MYAPEDDEESYRYAEYRGVTVVLGGVTVVHWGVCAIHLGLFVVYTGV